jgi:hypothetical protein
LAWRLSLVIAERVIERLRTQQIIKRQKKTRYKYSCIAARISQHLPPANAYAKVKKRSKAGPPFCGERRPKIDPITTGEDGLTTFLDWGNESPPISLCREHRILSATKFLRVSKCTPSSCEALSIEKKSHHGGGKYIERLIHRSCNSSIPQG